MLIAASRNRQPSARARSSTSRVFWRIVSSILSNACRSEPPAYSTAPQMMPPALATKSGIERTPRSWRIRSPADVTGMFAPWSTTLQPTRPALALSITSGRAAGTKKSTSRSRKASPSMRRPRGYAVTPPVASIVATSSSMSMPSGSWIVPSRSVTDTRRAPLSARNRADGRPTLPKPWMETVAPSRGTTPASSATSAAMARPKPVEPVSSSGTPPRDLDRPTERPPSSRIQAIAVSFVPMSGAGM